MSKTRNAIIGLVFALMTGAAPLIGASSAYAAPVVDVRSGIHDRYNRLVFDWTQNVKYTIKQENGTVTVQFNADATANFKPALAAAPPFIRNLRQTNTAEGLLVTFQIPVDSRVQAFASGKKIAFDVLRMKKSAPKFNDAPPAEPKQDITTGPQEIKKALAPEAEKLPQSPAPHPQTLADMLTDKPGDTPAAPSENDLRLPGAEEKQAGAVTPAAQTGTVIALTPSKLTRLAAFKRAGRLWMVIDQPQKEITPQITGPFAEQLKTATRIDLRNGTAFVFDLPKEFADTVFSVKRDGPTWQLVFNGNDKPYTPPEMAVNIDTHDKQPRVTFYAGEQPQIISVRDTALGDRLWILPMRSPDGRLGRARVTPGYKLLPSYMGAVIVPSSDDLRIATADDLVVLTAPEGKALPLSSETDREKGQAETQAAPVFRFPEVKEGDFILQRQAIEKKLVNETTPEEKYKLYISLARHYITQGFGEEALGVLRVADNELKGLQTRMEFRALRGVASALAGEVKQAAADLNSDDLLYQPVAKLWLGYALSRDNQWPEARAAFAESGTSETTLPPELRTRVILAKAETALRAGDVAVVQMELKKIDEPETLTPPEKAAYHFVRATALATAGKKGESLDLYDEIIHGKDDLYRARAKLEAVRQRVTAKDLTLEQAIDQLEGLRFSWRGDRLETEILRQLGQYYIDNKNYMQGLTVWRQAASLSKDTKDTDAITQAMQDTFKKLYVAGEADKMMPLRALAVFDRFRELTPAGEAGEIAQRRLADRLASVDLLEQSDAILNGLMKKQTSDEAAAALGAKLANIRLLNRDGKGAIKALDDSERNVVDAALAQRRVFLRARALADTGRADDALALLKDDHFPTGLSLKADILWRQNRWSEAVVTLQKLAASYRDQGQNDPKGPLPALVMKMAIAMALDDNPKGLTLLAAEYGDYMSGTDRAQSFNLITKPSRGSGLADLETLKNQVSEVELFEQFLKDFAS